MTTKPDYRGFAGYGAPAGPYGWYATEAVKSSDPTSRVSRSLWALVAVLGAATFGVSLGSSLAIGFLVRLAVLAAVIAAVGLLPRQSGRGWIVVAFAVTGLLDAVATWVSASGSNWALPVIVVLNALQSLAAVGALLSEAGSIRTADVGAQDYSAYANFVAAYQEYAMQYQQAPAQYHATGQASAKAQAVAQVSTDDSGDAAQVSEALRAKYAQYGGDVMAENAGSVGRASSPATQGAGTPGAVRDSPKRQPHRLQRDHSEEASST